MGNILKLGVALRLNATPRQDTLRVIQFGSVLCQKALTQTKFPEQGGGHYG